MIGSYGGDMNSDITKHGVNIEHFWLDASAVTQFACDVLLYVLSRQISNTHR